MNNADDDSPSEVADLVRRGNDDLAKAAAARARKERRRQPSDWVRKHSTNPLSVMLSFGGIMSVIIGTPILVALGPQLGLPWTLVVALAGVLVLSPAVAMAYGPVTLRQARAWAAGLPFGTDYPETLGAKNVTNVDVFVRFAGEAPAESLLQPALKGVSRFLKLRSAKNGVAEIAVSVRELQSYNYDASQLFRRLTDELLIPLHSEYPIDSVDTTLS